MLVVKKDVLLQTQVVLSWGQIDQVSFQGLLFSYESEKIFAKS